MRIGVDCRPLMEQHRTGVGEYTYQLIQALQSLSAPHEYIFFSSGIRKRGATSSSVHVAVPNKLVSAATFFFNRPYLDRIVEKKKGRLDAFFSPNLNFTSVSPKCRYALMIHDLSFELQPKWYTKKQRLWHRAVRPRTQCQRADAIIVPSENTKRDVAHVYGVDSEKIHVIYPGVFQEDFEKQKKTFEDVRKKYNLPEHFFLYLGTIEPRKNVDGIIKAFNLFKKQHPDHPAHLVLAGGWGWGSTLVRRLIDETPSVQYIGYVDAADKPSLYQLADVFVYPSFYEGFGLPVVEAMAYGVPVVASNRSSLPEVTQGKAALVNPYDVGEVADALQWVTKNPEIAQKIAEEAKQTAQNYQWQKTAQAFLSLMSHI